MREDNVLCTLSSSDVPVQLLNQPIKGWLCVAMVPCIYKLEPSFAAKLANCHVQTVVLLHQAQKKDKRFLTWQQSWADQLTVAMQGNIATQ